MPKNILKKIGIWLILLSVGAAVLTFGLNYFKRWWWDVAPVALLVPKSNDAKKEALEPASKEFGLVIPKLSINVPVVAEVDPTKRSIYDAALQTGVAQQKRSPAPDKTGNLVIFGHSSPAIGYPKTEYSEVFSLLDKLDTGDQINIWYQNRIYVYRVKEVKKISARDIGITANTSEKRLTIYTCWPPGTDLKRLAVIAEP